MAIVNIETNNDSKTYNKAVNAMNAVSKGTHAFNPDDSGIHRVNSNTDESTTEKRLTQAGFEVSYKEVTRNNLSATEMHCRL